MTDETLETMDGFVEDRPRDAEVSVFNYTTSNAYHEINEDGETVCGAESKGDTEIVTVECAVRRWLEPCQSKACTKYRDAGNYQKGHIETEDDRLPPRFFGYVWRDSKKVERAYWTYFWSVYEIASWVGVSPNQVRTFMEKEGIPRRKNGGGRHVRRMRDKGATLEELSIKYPDPRTQDDRPDGHEINEPEGLDWSDVTDE